MDGLLQGDPQVTTLAQAGLVSGETTGDELIAAQRPVGPEILRFRTTLRSACSAALLVGARAGLVVKVHNAGQSLRMLSQVRAVLGQVFWAEPRVSAA